MQPIENLKNDHEYIIKLLNVIDSFRDTGTYSIEHLTTITQIIKEFADGVHHYKEEELLFKLLVEKGFSFEQGPVAAMMSEHEIGRNYIKQAELYINQFSEGTTAVVPLIIVSLKQYSELLRAHISKENNILFAMALQIISPNEMQDLSQNFDAYLSSKQDDLQKYYSQIDDFVREYI